MLKEVVFKELGKLYRFIRKKYKPFNDNKNGGIKKCESCRNQSVKKIQETGKAVLGAATIIGGTVVAIATKGKNNHGDKS